MSKRVYLAGPFFNDEQIGKVDLLFQLLADNDTVGKIFVPMHHQQEIIVEKYGSLEEAMPQLEWQQATYRSDISAINAAGVVVAIMDYQNGEPDSGTMWEVGYAAAKGIPVVLVEFNSINASPLNLMLAQSYTAYFWGSHDIDNIRHYDFENMPQKNTDKVVF